MEHIEPMPGEHDEGEARFLIDKFLETNASDDEFNVDRHERAKEVVSQFARLAKSVGFTASERDGRTYVAKDIQRRAEILVLRDGQIEVRPELRGNIRGVRVPLRYSPLNKRLEGEPVDVAAIEKWRAPRRSALAVLTEAVLGAMAKNPR